MYKLTNETKVAVTFLDQYNKDRRVQMGLYGPLEDALINLATDATPIIVFRHELTHKGEASYDSPGGMKIRVKII